MTSSLDSLIQYKKKSHFEYICSCCIFQLNSYYLKLEDSVMYFLNLMCSILNITLFHFQALVFVLLLQILVCTQSMELHTPVILIVEHFTHVTDINTRFRCVVIKGTRITTKPRSVHPTLTAM